VVKVEDDCAEKVTARRAPSDCPDPEAQFRKSVKGISVYYRQYLKESTSVSILNHLHRPILEFYTRRDAKRLAEHFEELRDYRSLRATGIPDMKHAYGKYVAEFSTPEMAVSLETSQFLYVLAKAAKAKRILDLGSGFSSYVLRLYSVDVGSDTVVYSVDDDRGWLAKTREFLRLSRMREDFLLDWQAFHQFTPLPFDLIFHDLGNMALRAQSVPFVVSLLNPRGILILDDMHKTGAGPKGRYPELARKAVRQAGLTILSARHYTLDRYKRFCEVAIRLPM
jgi:predicted O-methyltransferase YrrM